MKIWTAQIVDDPETGKRSWESSDCPTRPEGMDEANGWRLGWYVVDADSGDTGNADEWEGPYLTEAEAIDDIKTLKFYTDLI